jgi:hypothetical protein
MTTSKTSASSLENAKMDVKFKLSALWVAVMFLFIYVDYFALYEPGSIEDIMAGVVWQFDITQAWALSAMVLMAIPTLMIFLSLALTAGINRWTNIIVGVLYIVVVIGSVIGETWAYYILGSVLELVLLALIVGYAWAWPKQQA